MGGYGKMKTTDITTRDSDIEVILGNCPLEPNMIRQEAYGYLKYLYTDLTDIRKYYIRLGFHLDEFERCDYFRDFGYLSMEDFCDRNLGLDKSAVSRCINVFREFNAADDVTYKNGLQKVGCKMDLSEKWKDYSYTQLCEMLPLTPDQRKKIKPDMTVKQIREYKKALKNKSVASTQQNDSEKDSVATSQSKIFDYDVYKHKIGIVQQNYIKSRNYLELVNVNVFDENGRKILCNSVGEILERPTHKNDHRLVIRMSSAVDSSFYISGSVNRQPDQEESCCETNE